jgi:hypothetical protein
MEGARPAKGRSRSKKQSGACSKSVRESTKSKRSQSIGNGNKQSKEQLKSGKTATGEAVLRKSKGKLKTGADIRLMDEKKKGKGLDALSTEGKAGNRDKFGDRIEYIGV